MQMLYNTQNDILNDAKDQKNKFESIENEIMNKIEKLERKKLGLEAESKKLK